MGKQNRSKRSEPNFAKGKVTPIQVAFIVDRYLSDNNFSETRSVFRTEASSLISKSPVREAPKSLLSLAAMLNEYVCLKEQKVMLEQEKPRLEQEKIRVHTLLNGMQDVLNAYNASSSTPAIQAPIARPAKSTVIDPQSVPSSGSPSGYVVHNTPTAMPMSMPPNTSVENEYLSPSVPNCPLTRKRAGSKAVLDTAPTASKKSRCKTVDKNLPNKASQSKNTDSKQDTAQTSSAFELSPHNRAPNGSLVQGSSVAKSLFIQPTPTNSTGPKTPPQPVSSQADKSPLGNSVVANYSANNTPQEITPTNCTVISSERVTVSPYKQMKVYTMERNHYISSSPVKTNFTRLNKRDHVKGRLDFDGSDEAVILDKPTNNEISTSDSDKEAGIFDLDFPNLDAFGPNFSFSELLVDFDIDCEGIGQPCQPTLGASMDNVSGSSHESGDANMGVDQVMSEYSSTMTQVVSGKDISAEGPDNTLTSVKSITKCIRILSPAKGCRNSLDHQSC